MIKSSDTSPGPDEPPLHRGSAANQVFVKLRDQILQGTLARGTKLPSERELAQRYQVSAPTIREAIRGLTAVRLVEVRHGTGMYVTAAVDALFAMATSALLEVEKVELWTSSTSWRCCTKSRPSSLARTLPTKSWRNSVRRWTGSALAPT